MSVSPLAAAPAVWEADSEKTCDLCAGRNFEPVADRDRRGRPLGTSICVRCGLVVHTHVPTEQQLVEFYAKDYRRDYHGELTPSDRRVLRAWRNGERLLAQLKPFLKSGDSVFEIGAGIGCTLKVFENAGFPASGIEPGEGFQQFSHDQLGVDVACSKLDELGPLGNCRLTLLVHVIEHFRSPREALDMIHAIMPVGGMLYVECPNLQAPFARPAKLFHYAHIHNFTPATLKMMAARCGFRLVKDFGSDSDPNLQMLLERVPTKALQLDADSYRRTWSALRRFNNLTYHARVSYLAPRMRKLASYLREHVGAKRQVAQILASCKSGGHGLAPKNLHRRPNQAA